ncbi:MAG: ATP-binding protein, partial [candidate division Zixibacteria bacterium]|nr:ATP-binding protein [candidate division Zixibacteria bacterium]
KQVVLNLLHNASQSIPDRGLIQVFAKLEKGDTGDQAVFNAMEHRVSLKVRDNGTGMSEEVKNKLFTPFFTTKEKGTGLGLSTVKKIVQAHKGVINIDSEPGKGTTVTIYLPQNL